MAIMTWTRAAKCKDCKYLNREESLTGRISHYCDNPSSEQYLKKRYKSDLVCEKWKWIFDNGAQKVDAPL